MKTVSASALTVVSLLALATPAQADWPSTNATKWVQYPDPTPNGLDVLAAQPAAGALPIILADDFLCTRTGPVTDIHIWASWLNDTNNCNLPITLCIWSDVPAITNGPNLQPSHPGQILWCQTFAAGQYSARPWKTANELFWNPEPPPFGTFLGQDHLIWQYNFYPTDPFIQRGTPNAPVVYWLSMTAGANIQRFGWKTATNHWNDDAVFGHLDAAGGNPLGDWQELRDPKQTGGNRRSLDLSFALTTRQIITNPPPATNKWVQYPDPVGLDVDATRPNILADDFLCTAAGTITNIQVWASWKDNITPDPSMRFELGIWSDVPGGNAGGTNTFSHPGALLWRETFTPGNYGLTFHGTGNELFYDPNTGELTPESSIWRYNFNPRKPFCQRGSANTPVVYWLSVRAFTTNTTNFRFGWKTSTNHWNDDAVFGHVTATGTAAGDWRELHDPRAVAALISLDLAFLINNGPPSADCDPHLGPKFVQWPDSSTNGLDVRATFPKMLADDFLCRAAGPISGVTIWGSWLGDNVDTNVVFNLSLWTDVPAIPGTTNFSRPGQLLCSTGFFPPQAIGTSLLRYKYRLDTPNVRETFYDPDLPGLNGLIGNDTQIWRYDFYPPACWRQDGSPFAAGKVFWLGVIATTDTNKYLFGWKTSTNHWNDDGVFGHVDSANNPLKDWKELHDPRPPANSLDLSFALRTFPIVGINKDLRNTTTQTATGIRIVVAGLHEVTWHYDDSPPWPIFSVSYSGGDTVLEWTGKTVAPGAISHVGFQMGGTSISIVSMAWLGATGGVIGRPIQVNQHTWNNGLTLTLNNDIVGTPVIVQPPGVPNAMVEFYDDPTPLDTMVPGGNRTPIVPAAPLPLQPTSIGPGCSLRIPVPTAPPRARYVLFIINLGDQQGQPATMDFLQLPLSRGLQPTIHSAMPMGNNLLLSFPTIPDRTYRVQSAPTLVDSFFDVFADLMGDGETMDVMLPFMGQQGYYRLVLDPE